MSLDPTERIAVMLTDLEEWEQLLHWVDGYFSALDLADNYRQGRPNLAPSKLTTRINRMHHKLRGYLDVPTE